MERPIFPEIKLFKPFEPIRKLGHFIGVRVLHIYDEQVTPQEDKRVG